MRTFKAWRNALLGWRGSCKRYDDIQSSGAPVYTFQSKLDASVSTAAPIASESMLSVHTQLTFVPSPPAIIHPQPTSDEETFEPGHTEPSLGLAQWLEQLHLDPATPRYHGEGSHRIVTDATQDEPAFVGRRPDGSSANHIAVNASLVKRRKEFWRTHLVRYSLLPPQIEPHHLSVGETSPGGQQDM